MDLMALSYKLSLYKMMGFDIIRIDEIYPIIKESVEIFRHLKEENEQLKRDLDAEVETKRENLKSVLELMGHGIKDDSELQWSTVFDSIEAIVNTNKRVSNEINQLISQDEHKLASSIPREDLYSTFNKNNGNSKPYPTDLSMLYMVEELTRRVNNIENRNAKLTVEVEDLWNALNETIKDLKEDIDATYVSNNHPLFDLLSTYLDEQENSLKKSFDNVRSDIDFLFDKLESLTGENKVGENNGEEN